MHPTTELIFDDQIESLIDQKHRYADVNTLVLNSSVDCSQLSSLCEINFFKNLEYLLFYDLKCNNFPDQFIELQKLEKLIINSNELDHFPEVLLKLPSLKHLQLELMDYKTFTSSIPSQCILEEIEFQTTPVKSLGTLSKIPTLKTIGILENNELQLSNEEINLVRH